MNTLPLAGASGTASPLADHATPSSGRLSKRLQSLLCIWIPLSILVGHTFHIEVTEEEQVLIVLAEYDLEHVLIEPQVFPPLVLLVLHLVPFHPGYSLQGDAGDGPCQVGNCMDLVLVVPEGAGGELEPPRDEVRLHPRFETVQLTLAQGRVMWVND